MSLNKNVARIELYNQLHYLYVDLHPGPEPTADWGFEAWLMLQQPWLFSLPQCTVQQLKTLSFKAQGWYAGEYPAKFIPILPWMVQFEKWLVARNAS